MINDIAYEQIRDSYYYGAYGEFKLIINKEYGYINATKLCKDGGKHFFHWNESKASKQLKQVLENHLKENYMAVDYTPHNSLTLGDTSIGIPSEVCKYVQTENKTEVDCLISGTYCHPLLVPHIASWIR